MDALLRLCVKIDLHPEADEGIISADLGLGRENGKLLDPTAPLVDVEGVVEGATEPILSVALGGEDHKVLGGIL